MHNVTTPPLPLAFAARRRVASIWFGVAALALLVAVLLVAHAAASLALLRERMHQQAHTAATQAALQIGASLRHVGDVVLHTKVAFEEFGPGLIERDPVSQARADSSQRPYRFIAIVNALGDSVLVLPLGAEVPSLPALAADLANRHDARLLTEVHRDADAAPLLLQAHRLVYADGTYAGAVVGALDPDLVARTLGGQADHRLLRLSVVDATRRKLFGPGPVVDAMADDDVEPMPIDGTPWTVLAAFDEAAVRSLALRELLPAVLGSVAMWLLLAGGGMFLSRSIRREIDSELRAQAAASQAELRSRFMAHMSHEIRTPINGVLGASELLAAAPLPPGQMRLVEVVRGSSHALLEIVNDLLDASRIDAGQLRVEERAYDAAATVEDVVELFAAPAQAKGLSLVQVIEPELPARLLGDPLRLRQVLTNLVSNAVKFTERGSVVVRCGVDADQWHWWARVDDTGIGISEHDQRRLFRPFEQADASMARRFGGTGLGLWIARGLAALMGGSLGLESAPGVGSRVLLRLPLRRPDAGTATAEPADAPDLGVLAGARLRLVCAPGPELESLQRHLAPAGITLQALGDDALGAFLSHGPPGGSVAAPSLAGADGAPCDLVLLHAASFDLSPALAWSLWQRQPESRLDGAVLLVGRADSLARADRPPWPAGTPAAALSAPVRRSALWATLAALRRGPIASPADASGDPCTAAPRAAIAFDDATFALPADAPRVLAAEDNEVNQLILVESLNRLGFHVDVACDGAQALRAFACGRYVLVLMDCQMPQMDGYAATSAIRQLERADPAARRVPIVALTAHAGDEDRVRCLSAGMDDHLAKPYSLDALAATLQRWVGHAGVRPAEHGPVGAHADGRPH